MTGSSIRSAGARARALAVAVAVAVMAAPGFTGTASAGTVLHVATSGCSDEASGAVDAPFCTIQAAADVATAGTTVSVGPGTYDGTVEVENSGTEDAPVTFEAAAGGATVVQGGTYGFKISGRDWITVRGFQVQDTSSNGFYVSGSTGIVLDRNRVTRAGLRLEGYGAAGMYLSATTASTVSGNTTYDNSASGIYLTKGTTGVQVTGNESMANAYGWQRDANGIDVRAPGNTIIGNRTHHNEDTGIQFYPGGNDNVAAGNLTWGNVGFTTVPLTNCSHPSTGDTSGCITGDHGIDNLAVTGNTITGNTVYDNATAGINVEGIPSGTPSGFVIKNNLAVDNALRCPNGAGGFTTCPRTKGNIRVDKTSQLGTVLDRDVVWLSASGVMMAWGVSSYASLSAFQSASGQEASARQADPLLRDPNAGDFRLLPGSAAIDMADSSAGGAQGVDILGRPRVDDPATTDAGVGPRTFDDAGAVEFQLVPAAPVLQATPGHLSVDLSWTAPTESPSAVTSYTLYRRQGTSPAEPVTTTAGSVTSYTDGSVDGWKTYTYTVTANANGDESPHSAPVTATPTGLAEPPEAPALTVTAGDRSASLSWTPPAERGSPVTGYVVHRGSVSGGEVPLVEVGADVTTFEDVGLENNTPVWYQVSARSAAGDSALSLERSAVPTPISFVAAASTALTAAKTSVVMKVPAGVQAGDLMVAWLSFGSLVSGVSGLSAWTPLPWSPLVDGNNSVVYAYSKVAGTGEVDVPVSWSSSAKAVLGTAAYRGVDPANPIDVSAGLASDGKTSATVSTPTVSSPDGTRWALSLLMSRTTASAYKAVSWTPDIALTERLDANNAGSASAPWMGIQAADSAGAVTAGPHRYSGVATSAESHHESALLYLNPAGGL